ncbi:MAG: BatA domain-containing protein, partial [Planctomycetota bacterium]
MSFGFVPALLGVLGLGAIAGLLYALQRLRVRHQEVEVETTMFWRQAIEESRARVLTQRFRHPWTYALLLSICSLLWLAFAGLRSDASD